MTTERAVVHGTLRAMRITPVALSAALGVIPILLIRAANAVDVAVLGASVVTALGIGYALDDSAANTLDPVPVTLRVRSAIRIVTAAGIAATGWLAQLITSTVIHANGRIPRWGWLSMTVALAASTLAVAAIARQRNPAQAGMAAVWAAPALVAVCFVQWQFMASIGVHPLLTTVASDPTVDRWWAVSAIAAVVLVQQTRDRGARAWVSIRTRPEIAT